MVPPSTVLPSVLIAAASSACTHIVAARVTHGVVAHITSGLQGCSLLRMGSPGVQGSGGLLLLEPGHGCDARAEVTLEPLALLRAQVRVRLHVRRDHRARRRATAVHTERAEGGHTPARTGGSRLGAQGAAGWAHRGQQAGRTGSQLECTRLQLGLHMVAAR